MTNQKPAPPVSEPAPYRRDSFDKATLADRVYEALREDILANRLLPSTPLQEETLANAMGVSRGPIREATRRLAAEGLVSVVPRRGAVVSSLTRAEFLSAYQVREALEAVAVRLAAPRLAAAEMAQLETCQQTMGRAAREADWEAFAEANARFHGLFVERSENRMLQEMYYPLVDQMRRYRLRSMASPGGMERSCQEHRAILDAIGRSQVDEAVRLVSEHFQTPQRILESTDGDKELELAALLATTDELRAGHGG